MQRAHAPLARRLRGPLMWVAYGIAGLVVGNLLAAMVAIMIAWMG